MQACTSTQHTDTAVHLSNLFFNDQLCRTDGRAHRASLGNCSAFAFLAESRPVICVSAQELTTMGALHKAALDAKSHPASPRTCALSACCVLCG